MAALKISKKTRPSALLGVIYGPAGAGKTTFAASAPNPVFLDLDGGASFLPNISQIEIATDYPEILAAMEAFAEDQQGFKTLVVDALTGLESAIAADVCRIGGSKGPVQTLLELPFGSGFTKAQSRWIELFKIWKTLVAGGTNVILLAHSVNISEADPVAGTHELRGPNLHKRPAALVGSQADWVGFLDIQRFLQNKGTDSRELLTSSAILSEDGSPQRSLTLSGGSSCVAKNRFGISENLVIPAANGYSVLTSAIRDSLKQGA